MKKFKWNRWPRPKSKFSLSYVSPVRMWKSEVVLVRYEEVEGQKVPVYMVRGIDTRKYGQQDF